MDIVLKCSVVDNRYSRQGGHNHVTYVVDVERSGSCEESRFAAPKKYQLSHRFRDFYHLREMLRSRNNQIGKLSFPSRVTVVQSNVRDNRQKVLEAFLNDAIACSKGNAECLSMIYAFLGVYTTKISCVVHGFNLSEKQVCFYNVVVADINGKTYTVAKRFSDFYELYEKSKAHVSRKSRLHHFPSKVLGTGGKAALRARRQQLEDWLKQLNGVCPMTDDLRGLIYEFAGVDARGKRMKVEGESVNEVNAEGGGSQGGSGPGEKRRGSKFRVDESGERDSEGLALLDSILVEHGQGNQDEKKDDRGMDDEDEIKTEVMENRGGLDKGEEGSTAQLLHLSSPIQIPVPQPQSLVGAGMDNGSGHPNSHMSSVTMSWGSQMSQQSSVRSSPQSSVASSLDEFGAPTKQKKRRSAGRNVVRSIGKGFSKIGLSKKKLMGKKKQGAGGEEARKASRDGAPLSIHDHLEKLESGLKSLEVIEEFKAMMNSPGNSPETSRVVLSVVLQHTSSRNFNEILRVSTEFLHAHTRKYPNLDLGEFISLGGVAVLCYSVKKNIGRKDHVEKILRLLLDIATFDVRAFVENIPPYTKMTLDDCGNLYEGGWYEDKNEVLDRLKAIVSGEVHQGLEEEEHEHEVSTHDKQLLVYFFYDKFNPDNIGLVPQICADYKGEEDLMMSSLVSNYNLEDSVWLEIAEDLEANPEKLERAKMALPKP
mmetsp:Transcript_14139/g.28855  ORF Transcript_14139/g.28855 Transcript_14139/m.28855 type:complete len:708 (-) Transcript_14139:85-2208(-)